MNGYVHGVYFVPGFAYYKIFVIAIDVLCAAGFIVIGVFVVRNVRRRLKK